MTKKQVRAEMMVRTTILSLEEMAAAQEEYVLLEEHVGSVASEMEGPELAVLFGLEAMPEEAFRTKREQRRAVRDRWS